MRVLRRPLDGAVTCTVCGELQDVALRIGQLGHPPHTIDLCRSCAERAVEVLRTLRACYDREGLRD